MEDFDRTAAYIESLSKDMPAYLAELERAAIAEQVPVIRPAAQDLLRFVLAAHCPRRILEIGTATGFSALFMREYTPSDTQILTIENYEKRIRAAENNFNTYDTDHRILLLEGDAVDLLGELAGSFDLIFLDAAKGQYLHFLKDLLRLLSPGGILLSDNVLQEGDIVESRYIVERRDRTIHKRMREFLFSLTHDDALETVILPVGDGMSVTYKKDAHIR